MELQLQRFIYTNNRIIAGGVAGILIPLAVSMFDKLKLDDPVEQPLYNLVCGIGETLAVGLLVPELVLVFNC
ncbi:MAG: hypothetical protein R2728_06435 [Chitinophagales bacterium]